MADFDPSVRARPNFPYIEFAKAKKFNSAANTTPQEIVVPVFLDARTEHRHPIALASYRKEAKVTLVGYGNLDSPKYAQLKAQLDSELTQSTAIKEYMSAMQTKVAKAKDVTQKRSSE